MASNSVPVDSPTPSSLSTSRASQIVGTVTAIATEIEQVVAASGVGGTLNIGGIEQLTALFGNLAGVAIQAAHDVMGKPITPESVLALMPGTTPLAAPPPGSNPAT